MTLITIVSVLSACGGGSNTIEGKYVKAKKSNLCPEYMNFQKDNALEVKNSEWVNGSIWDATYEVTEDKDYKYKVKYDDERVERYKFKFSDDKKKLTTSADGDDYKCEFKLEE